MIGFSQERLLFRPTCREDDRKEGLGILGQGNSERVVFV